jgi:predicted DCC family thiol-disulfide oxidoreductase YuxK
MSPDEPILILYEAKCGFCNACRRFVEKRAGQTTFRFIDIYSGDAAKILQQNNIPQQQYYDSIIALADNVPPSQKYKACLYIARHLQQPWPTLARLFRIIPDCIGNWGYTLVSKNRHHL